MNSFISARFQRKMRKFPENPPSGSRVLGLGSRIPPMSWVPGLGSGVSSLGSHPQDGSRVSGLWSHQQSRVTGFPFSHLAKMSSISF